MNNPDDLTPPRMVISGRSRWWVFADGTRLPVISGGAVDDEGGDDDGGGEDDGDDGGGEDGEEEDEDDEDVDPRRAKAALRKKNRENASLRRRLKAAEAAEAELKKIRDKEKSEGQKLGETTEELSKAQLKVARLEVALEKGLTLAQANRLVGTTKDELAEDADAYLEELGLDDERPTKKPARRPKEKVRRSGTGTTETDDDDEDDPRALAAKVARRF